MAKNSRRSQKANQANSIVVQAMTIEMLSDDVLLEIFGFCVGQGQDSTETMKSWQLLIHICRRWRIIVFGSPRRLNLQLFCTPRTPAGDTLCIWPALPSLLRGSIYSTLDAVNAITMLNYSDRMRIIDFKLLTSEVSYISAAMQKPSPELTHLQLNTFYDGIEPVIPDLFLGRSAPRLRVLSLTNVKFPGLLRLVLSTTHLVTLYLHVIPYLWEVSPETIATALPVLTRLEILWLGIEFSQYGAFSGADGQRRPPSTRSVLPALTRFTFRGKSEDLEILVAQLDTPLLNRLSVTFSDPVHSYTPQLARFVGHAPRFRAIDEANIVFRDSTVTVKLTSQAIGHEGPVVSIQSKVSVSTLAHICTPPFPPLSTLERLRIYGINVWQDEWLKVAENIQWLEILRSFTATKDLFISQPIAPQIVSDLQELVGGGVNIEVLPILQNIFLEELQLSRPIQEGIEQFVAARQLSGHPINVSQWSRPDREIFHDFDLGCPRF